MDFALNAEIHRTAIAKGVQKRGAVLFGGCRLY